MQRKFKDLKLILFYFTYLCVLAPKSNPKVRKMAVAAMATICETIEENTSTLHIQCKPECPCKDPPVCPPDCACKTDSPNSRTLVVFFNALGILVAILATYMIISTDSKLYLIFWICYSVLRRMMIKSNKTHLKSD